MKLYTVVQFCQQNPAFSEASLRWLLFNAKANGLHASGAVLRNGRRILINADRFYAWLEASQPLKGAARHASQAGKSSAPPCA